MRGKLMGRRVLVTGGLGFIGSNLSHRFLELGAKVSIYDCLDPHSGGNLRNIKEIRESVEVLFHDILDFQQLADHVANKDIIVNCAASTSHPVSMREPWFDMDVNSRGVINLLEAIRRYNGEAKFIHLGTSTQLGRLQYQPADEKHPEFPTDIYSANKCASEKYVLIYAAAHGMRAGVIRLSNVFGPRACIKSADFTFNNYFIGLALQDKEITVYGDGKQKRNVIYVDDAVEAIITAAQSDATDGATMFAVGDEHYSVAEIAVATVKHMGSGRVQHVEWPAGRRSIEVGDAIISNRKIKEMLGWAPKYGLASGLVETRKYYEPCLKEYIH